MRVVPARFLPRLRFSSTRAKPASGRPRRRWSRAAVGWLPVAFALCVVLAWAGVDAFAPERADPEYLARRDLLRDRTRERPDARLAVVFGSSRTGCGFAPELLPAGERSALWFNLSHYGAGPVFNLVILNRVIRDGFRPDVAVIEVMPPFATREHPRFLGTHFSAGELAFASDYLPPGPLLWQWFRHRFVKVGSVKQTLDPHGTVVVPGPFGGPANPQEEVTPTERDYRTGEQRRMYVPLAGKLEVSPAADRALRDTLRVCREHGITPVLLLAPEGSEFRGWYDPARLRRFDEAVAVLAAEHGVRLIDARDWLPDADFADGHHPLRRGAEAFTRRLVREVEAR